MTNALGQVVNVASYDAVGRVATIKKREDSEVSTSYAYDLAGRRTQSTVSGGDFNLASFVAYDAVGQVTNTVDPAGYGNAFTYDAAGNVIKHVNENGHASTFTYDSMNRLSYVRDPLGTWWSNVYNRIGNVTRHLPSYCSNDTFSIDKLGRVAQMTSPAGSFTCSYNAASLVTWLTFNDGRENTFSCDAGYRLTNVSSVGAGSSCVCASYAYDAVGNLTNIAAGGSQSLATILSYGYDPANQRTSRRLCMSNLVVQDAYQYDALGRTVLVSNQFVSAS